MQAALQLLEMCHCFHLHDSLGCAIKSQATVILFFKYTVGIQFYLLMAQPC